MAFGRRTRGAAAAAAAAAALLLVAVAAAAAADGNAFATGAGRRGLLQQSAGCFDSRTVIAYAGSGGLPDLAEVAAALPFDKKKLLPLGSGEAVLLDLEAPGACNPTGVTSLPGSLLLFDNGTLAASLPRLASLAGVGKTLMVYGKSGLGGRGLANLQALKGFASASSLLLYNLDALTDLRGLEAITQLPGELILSDNAKLANLRGLEGLTSVGGDLALLSNMALVSVQGLGNLKSIGGQLVAKGNGNLKDLLPLSSLASLRSISETNNGDKVLELPDALRVASPRVNAVASASSASAAAAEGGDVAADAAFGSRFRADVSVVVVYAGKAPTANDVGKWLNEFMPPLDKLDVREYNARLVDLYGDEAKKLGTITGHLVIWSTSGLGKGLWALSGLTAVYGQMVVVGGPDGSSVLETVQGLDNLKYAGGLSLVGLPRLRDLNGLGSLATVAGDFNILFCGSLESTRGLGPIPSVYSGLWVQSCNSLKDLDGFKNVRSVGAWVHLDRLPALQSLDGLAALETVYGELLITQCGSLPSTAGLKSLSRVGKSLSLTWNDQLSDLSGLSRISSVPSDLLISGNPALSSLSPLFSITSVGINLVVANNPALKDLSGLGSVTRVGSLLSVSNNAGLKSLGLAALQSVGSVNIVNNPSLNYDEAERLRGKAGDGGTFAAVQRKKLLSCGTCGI